MEERVPSLKWHLMVITIGYAIESHGLQGGIYEQTGDRIGEGTWSGEKQLREFIIATFIAYDSNIEGPKISAGTKIYFKNSKNGTETIRNKYRYDKEVMRWLKKELLDRGISKEIIAEAFRKDWTKKLNV